MLTQAATTIRMLALALWVGGGAALDFIDAPLRFAGGIIDRNQAVGLGQAVITRWIRAEWALGVIALAASLVAAGPAWSAWLIVFMLAVVTVQGAYLAPAITHLARGLDFVHRASQDPRYVSIRHLHTAYSVCEVAVLLAGVVALAATARGVRR
jgi:hypothetical protein